MMVNAVIFLLVILLFAFFVWLATRANRARSAGVRWLGMILSGLLALVLAVVVILAGVGYYRLNFPLYNYQTTELKIEASPKQIALGGKKAVLCADCHSTNQKDLDGSAFNFLEGSPIGVVYAPNLTPGGPLKDWTDAEVVRAIREGVDPQGKTLIIMPSEGLHAMSDSDAQAIVAFLRSLSSNERQTPERELSFMALVLIGANQFPLAAQEPITGPVIAPPAGTVEYGKYITDSYGCRDCHGKFLEGNEEFGGPKLVGVISGWTEDQFLAFFETGKDPNGKQSSDEMPWRGYNIALSDSEQRDLYDYLHSLTPEVSTN